MSTSDIVDRPKSPLISNAGKVFELIKVLVRAVEEEGGSEEDLRRLLSSYPHTYAESAAHRTLGKAIVGKEDMIPFPMKGMKFFLNLNPNLFSSPPSRDFNYNLLVSAGQYDRVKLHAEPTVSNKDLQPLFQGVYAEVVRISCASGGGVGESSLWHIEHKDMLNQMSRMRARSASLAEFLVFGAAYPDIQRWTAMMFLGPDYRISLYGNRNERTFRIEKSTEGPLLFSHPDILTLVVPLDK